MRLPDITSTGPTTARVMIVGEFPSVQEADEGVPFAGASLSLLREQLNLFGFNYDDCFVTLACPYRPPGADISQFYLKDTKASRIPGPEIEEGIDRLNSALARVNPDLILALGETALWALTGNKQLKKWRGSILQYDGGIGRQAKIIPTFSPSYLNRMWADLPIFQRDLQRAQTELSRGPIVTVPDWRFITRPTYEQVHEYLDQLETYPVIACDIETRNQHISCIGFATSTLDSFCIPFMCVEDDAGYWTLEQETSIVQRITWLFHHAKATWIFQNGLYDLQYFARYWGTVPRRVDDTMILHHVQWCDMPKGLDFLSSLHCDYHTYWKDEGKEWDPSMPEEQHWEYNCKDCVATFEVFKESHRQLEAANLTEQYAFQMKQFWMVLDMMIRGVRINLKRRAELAFELMDAKDERERWLTEVIGHPLNPRSPKQMQTFFYEDMKVPKVRNRKTGRLSCDSKSLVKVAAKQPILKPIIDMIEDIRSIGVFHSTFVSMPLDRDKRARTSYNICGTDTFRYSSSKNAFNSGGNLQNLPKGDEEGGTGFQLPNIRQLFIPDPGHMICECDLDRADVQVVAWDAGAERLKEILRSGEDLHTVNAKDIFGERATKAHRHLAKAGCHATNYVASPRTLATALGITMREAEHFQSRWFSIHPEILEWHRRIESQLQSTRTITNKFGYRHVFLDRIESCLPEAVAWIPQSTVALVIDIGLVRVYEQLSDEVETLMQVHDSGIFQIEACKFRPVGRKLLDLLHVEVPYDDPLIIPVGMEASDKSWGDCVPVDLGR